jgi:hypothetical protein
VVLGQVIEAFKPELFGFERSDLERGIPKRDADSFLGFVSRD